MKNNEKANDWLKRAKSNLAFAKAGFFINEVLYEDLCFNAQQAAEKALYRRVRFLVLFYL